MSKELVVIEKKPIVPKNWSYEKSVAKVKQIVYKWKNLTTELATELWIAREALSKPGSHESGWDKYCEDIGVDRSTANRWLQRYASPDAIASGRQTPSLPTGKFAIIYADPPWQFSNSGFEQSAALIYPTMPTQDICNLPIREKVKENSVLFLWATNAMLEDALTVINAWGFIYKTNIVWIKDRAPGMGWFTQSKHELLLIAVKNDGLHPEFKPNSWIKAGVSKHSAKPHEFYSIIEKMYPRQTYIELFARNERKGWQSWGNEI